MKTLIVAVTLALATPVFAQEDWRQRQEQLDMDFRLRRLEEDQRRQAEEMRRRQAEQDRQLQELQRRQSRPSGPPPLGRGLGNVGR